MNKAPAAEIFIICSKSKAKMNFLANLIEGEYLLGFTHYSIAIRYDGQTVVSEAVWPRARFVTWDDWIKAHQPRFIFRKEVKNQLQLFEMMNWMAVLCTKSWYSILQLLLIYISLKLPITRKWVGTVKLNNDSGIICCEYVIRFLNKFFTDDFTIEVSEDSIGMREPFDALTQKWILLQPEQMVVLETMLGK